MAFLAYSQRALAANQPAIDWLQTERGLTAETVKAAGLGFNPADIFDSRQAWGLTPETKANGRTRKMWLPAGLIIPNIVDGHLHRIRSRRSDPGQGSRYIVVSGSSKTPMVAWADQKAVAIVESELDAILTNQEASDLIGTVALGSCAAKPDSGLHARLMNTERILLCLDADEAGAKAAAFWQQYPGCKRWPTIQGKDVTEQWAAGLPVRPWIEAGLT
jgi:DNA primase